MSKPGKAEVVVSVRMPAGVIERLKAATGQQFSPLVRQTMIALLRKLEAQRAAENPSPHSTERQDDE